MTATKYDSDVPAKQLYASLTQGLDITIPEIDFSKLTLPDELIALLKTVPTLLTNEDLTTREIGGDGVFDALMEATKVHLREEFEAGRITGAEYTKAYSNVVQTAMQCAVQFTLNRDQSRWTAITAQLNAFKMYAETLSAKVMLAKILIEANLVKTQYADGVLKLAIGDMQHTLINEQMEQARGATMDTRSDGTVITGSIAKSKALQSQQIVSYQRDSEVKAAKLWSDAYSVGISSDKVTDVASIFNETSINTVFGNIRKMNNLDKTLTDSTNYKTEVKVSTDSSGKTTITDANSVV